jgi:3-methyladenine DNA glycosylase/8-oxoguanine DNA glycosylase
LEQAEAWRPWRAYAAMHLWNDLSTPLRNRSKGRRRKVGLRGEPTGCAD